MPIPRPEHPRPQFRRADWINLNGTWTFALDPGRSGIERGLPSSTGFDRRITVPFCVESRLSGVGATDFVECLWYHRRVDIPREWQGRRALLHFGGVDFESEVFVDGRRVGSHFGGTCSFHHDITDFVKPGGTHHLVVRVRDDIRSGAQPSGKQCHALASRGCYYTRTTGIWQTVWMEAVHPNGLAGVHILPDWDGARFIVTPRFFTARPATTFRAALREGESVVAEACVAAADGVPLILSLDDPKPWTPGQPFLYDLDLEVLDAQRNILDRVSSYAGLRKVHIEGDRLFLNHEELYLRMVLDQGFYPDGIWTAPSDDALRGDIELAMAAGFNGARLHQKVFEERYHYWADRLGFLTWGESASWGLACMRVRHPNESLSGRAAESAFNFLAEWREIVLRDRNHPSIIAWTPFNETREASDWEFHRRLHIEAYETTKAFDPTRPVNDASGYVHQRTDLWTLHQYAQDPVKLREALSPPDGAAIRPYDAEHEAPYQGQPVILAEFGGTWWRPGSGATTDRNASWGYGEAPKSEAEFYARLQSLVETVLSLPRLRGYCYTQLTDVEQEQNGLYTCDRKPKFDMTRLAAIFRRAR